MYKMVFFVAIILMVACSESDLTSSDPAVKAIPLHVSSGIAGLTRVTGTSWESGDKIGVFTTEHDNTTTSTKSGSVDDANISYQIDATADGYEDATAGSLTNAKGFVPESSVIYLPFDGSPVDVYAYYPRVAGIGANGVMGLDVNSTRQATPSVIDLLTASTPSTTTAPISALHPSAALLFSHRLSKITINIKAGTGYSDSEILNQTVITLTGTPISANYNLYTSSFSDFSAATNIVAHEVTSVPTGYLETHEIIVLPNETGNEAAAGRTLSFKVGDTTNGYYTYTIPETKEFEQGKNTIYNITLSPTGLNVTAAIVAWSDVTAVSQTLK